MKNELFGEIREFTKEEAKLHEKSIYEMFKPTGKNIFFEGYETEKYFQPCEGYMPVINL